MTQVSRFKLKPDVWGKIFNLLTDTILSFNGKRQLESFIEDFFTPTEKIMYAKRLAIIVLLAKGNNYQEIRTILRVTPATIAKMSLLLNYEGKGIFPVIHKILKKESTKIFWEELLDLLDLPTKGSKIAEWHKRKLKSKRKIYRLTHEL